MIYPKPTSEAVFNLNLTRAKDYHRRLGRPLRVAHVGNIANNAYLAAKHQRTLGIDAYVFSPDYVHVMGFPEWEECNFERDSNRGHFDSNFPEVHFEKPSWFFWGSWTDIVSQFSTFNDTTEQPKETFAFIRLFLNQLAFFTWKFTRPFLKMITPIKFRAWAVNSVLIKFRKLGSYTAQNILNSFDVIHFYGPYNFLVATCEIQVPFVSTEHGTLRDYIFSEYAQAKMSRIGYQLSAAVIVTNQDSYPSALKTGVASENIIFGPHPINQNDFQKLNLERLSFSPKHPKVLIPARQVKRSSIDAGKGNNEILQAIKQSVENNLGIEFLIPLWGDNVKDTLNLAEELSILDKIKWLPLVSRPALKKIMNESIAVIDQLNVRAYGAVGADALALGVPLITAAGLQNDELAFGSMAPIFDATTAHDIYRHLEMLVHGNFDYVNHANISQEWFKKHISMEIATSRSFDAYDMHFNSSSDSINHV